MRRIVVPAMAALALFAAANAVQAQQAQQKQQQPSPPPQSDQNVSSDQLIKELSPPAGAPTLRFRGLHLLTSQPAAEAQMPSVGLDIQFKLNSSELTDQAKDQVKQLAEAIKSEQLSKYHFLVEGHTDSLGSPSYNLALSKRRAQAVREYLVVEYHVPASRLEAIGRGSTMPINAADPANPANRRVQVVNLGQ
jgi:outer membrane protein OmpA-like peptidoglycan-associated protein